MTARDGTGPKIEDLTEVTPECPGRYTVLWEAGRGGIGRVVLAEDRHTGRQIAIKELLDAQARPRDGSGSVTGAAARFLWEARITAQLEHPGIVPVYEIGQRPDGTFYYAMKFIRGRTLMDAISEADDTKKRLSLLPHFLNLCNALAFAHSKGIVHRDIKPGNVMIGQFGETVVIDWGLAKAALSEQNENSLFQRQAEALKNMAAGQTMVGQAVGTPAYMAPEQARGRHRDVDERSDVYALGAVLYQILTGLPPFNGANAQEILLKVIAYSMGTQPLLTPLDLDPDVPPELSAVALKALDADRSKRYASAKELAEDVEAFMTGRRVSAYRYSTAELVTRFVRRHKAAVASSAAITLSILAALVLTSLSYRKEHAARRREQQARVLEHHQRLKAHWHLARAQLQKSLTLVSSQRILEAGLVAAKGLIEDPAFPGSPYHDPAFVPPRGHEARYMEQELASMLYLAKISPIRGATRVLSLRREPHHVVLSSQTGQMLVYSKSKVEVIPIEPDHEPVVPPQGAYLTHTNDGDAVAVRDAQDRVIVWNLASGTRSSLPRTASLPVTAAFVSMKRLVTGHRDGTVRTWDLPSKSELSSRALFIDPVTALAVCPNGTVAVASGRRLAVLPARPVAGPGHEPSRPPGKTDNQKGTPRPEAASEIHETEPNPISCLAMDRRCRLLAVGFEDGTILLRTLGDDPSVQRLPGHRDSVRALRFSRRGRMLASASWDGSIRLWSRTGRPMAAVAAHKQGVRDITFSSDGSFLVSLGADRRAILWRLAQPTPIRELASGVGPIKTVVFSNDGRLLAAGGADRAAAVWDFVASRDPLVYLPADAIVRALAFSSDSRDLLYATGSVVRTVRVEDGTVLRSSPTHHKTIRSLVSCRNGSFFISAGLDGHLLVWSTKTGTKSLDLNTKSPILEAALSPDCHEAATAGLDGRILLWSLDDAGRQPKLLARHDGMASAVSYSPDGRLVASGGKSGLVLITDRKTGRNLARLQAHGRWINRVAFSADEKLLATGSDDRKIWIWDTATWRPIIFIPTTKEAVGLSFSADGRHLALGDQDRLLIYPMTLEHLTEDLPKRIEALRAKLAMPRKVETAPPSTDRKGQAREASR